MFMINGTQFDKLRSNVFMNYTFTYSSLHNLTTNTQSYESQKSEITKIQNHRNCVFMCLTISRLPL